VEAKTYTKYTEWTQFWDCRGGQVYAVETSEVEEIVEIDRTELLAEEVRVGVGQENPPFHKEWR